MLRTKIFGSTTTKSIFALTLTFMSISRSFANDSPVTINNYGCTGGPNENQRIMALENTISELNSKVKGQRDLGLPPCMENINITDCSDVFQNGNTNSGVYMIQPEGSPKPFSVYCLFDGEGQWTVIQQRTDGSVDFQRNWVEYKKGFGVKGSNEWLGNERIHQLTSQRQYMLRVDITDWEEVGHFAEYRYFMLDGEEEKYAIRYANYSGTAGDSLEDYHLGRPFSTFERDHDNHKAENCADLHGGGWWYNECDHSNLNGPYNYEPILHGSFDEGIEWNSWRPLYSFKKTMMRVMRAFHN